MSVRPHPTKSKKDPGRWWYVILGRGKNRTYTPFNGTFEEAARFEKGLLQQTAAVVIPAAAPRIKEMIIPFLDWYKEEASPRTIRDFRFSIDLYFVPWFGNLQPRQLSLQLFNDFKSSLIEKGLAPVTVNKHLNYFSSLLKWGVEYGHCQELSFKIPRYQKKRTAAERKQPLSQRQVDALYLHIEPKYRLLLLLMVDHGLRQEEAVNIKVSDINEDNKTIIVFGKGSKYRIVPFMSTRFIDELEEALKTRIDGYLVVHPATKAEKEKGIIPNRPYTTIWKAIKRAATKAGITREVNHHLLRHTFSTSAAENGMNPHALQKILGHASIETTNQIYTNVGQDFVGDAGRILIERKGR